MASERQVEKLCQFGFDPGFAHTLQNHDAHKLLGYCLQQQAYLQRKHAPAADTTRAVATTPGGTHRDDPGR